MVKAEAARAADEAAAPAVREVRAEVVRAEEETVVARVEAQGGWAAEGRPVASSEQVPLDVSLQAAQAAAR